jgi:hypothetical protein
MNTRNSKKAKLLIGLSVILILSSSFATYYYITFDNAKNAGVRVNICIDYQKYNNTIVWYNNTMIPNNSTLYVATIAVANVNASEWGGGLGKFVDAINGVWTNGSAGYYWMWYQWNPENQTWVYGPLGASNYIMSNNEIIRWRYEFPNEY